MTTLALQSLPVASNPCPNHDEKNALILRTTVQALYFEQGLSKNQIAKQLQVSKGFVVKWTQAPNQDTCADARGWPKNKRRRYDQHTVERVRQLHTELLENEREFFTGSTAITQRWQGHYPDEAIPSLRLIETIMANEGLSKPRKRGRSKGRARYLCYPEETIYERISTRLLEADFIGQKYLRGRSQPLNFLGLSFKKTPRLRYYRRIEGQTTEVLLRECAAFFARFERPDAIKVDNAMAMSGTARGKRSLSRFMQTMLKQQVLPIFAVPRKPFSQGSIEGNNSVFARKFWNTYEFTDLEQIDQRLDWFNAASQRYCGYRPPTQVRPRSSSFLPRVYFIRQVLEDPAQIGQGQIRVLNEEVSLDAALINYFVLAEWQPTEGLLHVYLEKEQEAERIKSIPFELNPNSSYRLD